MQKYCALFSRDGFAPQLSRVLAGLQPTTSVYEEDYTNTVNLCEQSTARAMTTCAWSDD